MIIKPQWRHQSISTAWASQHMIPSMASSRTYIGPAYYDFQQLVTSMMVRIESKPSDLRRSVMRFIDTYWKGPDVAGTSNHWSGAFHLGRFVFNSWHLSHQWPLVSSRSLSQVATPLPHWWIPLFLWESTLFRTLEGFDWAITWLLHFICCYV